MQRGAPFVWGRNKSRVFRNGENPARRAAWVRAFWLPRRHLTTGGTRLDPKVEADNESGPGSPGAGSHLAGRVCIWLSRPGSERCGQAGTAAANGSAVAAQWVLYGVPSPRAESARVPQVRRELRSQAWNGGGTARRAHVRPLEGRGSVGACTAVRQCGAREQR